MSNSVIDDAPMSGFHWRIAVLSAGGPFLDGWVLSIIGLVLLQAVPALGMSDLETGLTGAAALVGMFVGGSLGGYLCDRLGRQAMYAGDLIALVVCSILSAFVADTWQLVLLRFVIGIAVGADYPIAVALLAEFVPRRHRGTLLSALVVAWFAGSCVSYLVGYWLASTGSDGWRWMLGSAAVPALVIVLLRARTPESPRWLLSKGRREQAETILKNVFGREARVEDMDEPDRSVGTRVVLRRKGYVGRILFVTAFQSAQIIPLYAIYTYLPRMLATLGFTDEIVTYLGGFVSSAIVLVGGVIGMLYMDRWGRRPVLILPFVPMAGALLLLGFASAHATTPVVVGFCVYSLFSGITGLLVWSYPGELFPTEIRSTATGLITAATRVGAAMGTFLVPLAIAGFGIGITMLIGAGITAFGLVVSIIWAPETTRRPLSETSAADNGVPTHTLSVRP